MSSRGRISALFVVAGLYDGILGLVLGLALMPVVNHLIVPVSAVFSSPKGRDTKA